MIVDLVMQLLGNALFGFVSVLPDMSSAITWLEALPAQVGSFGPYLGAAEPVFPVSGMLSVLTGIVPLYAVYVAYRVFSWAWRHFPEIAGFGTGNG